jgi:hypothetical protein
MTDAVDHLALVDRGIVRVLDLVMVRKDDDGLVEAYEIADLDDSERGSFARTRHRRRCCSARTT